MNEIFGALLLRARWSDRDKLGVYTHVFRDGRHDGAIAGRIPASGMGAGTVRSALDDFGTARRSRRWRRREFLAQNVFGRARPLGRRSLAPLR